MRVGARRYDNVAVHPRYLDCETRIISLGNSYEGLNIKEGEVEGSFALLCA
jgi:hypothetical protein